MHPPNSSITAPSHQKYRPDIDGLRAIAVLSVVGFHAFGVMGGYAGVDIFFVISGFLISTIIFEGLDKNSFSFADFYQRRIRRIFPSLFLVLITCLIFGWLALFADEYRELGKHVSSGAGFVSNLVLWQESGYFDSAAEKKFLLHLWSLGIEEQFYIFWPLLTFFLWRLRKHFLWILFGLLFTSFFLNIWFIGEDSIATFYSPFTRFWELLCGACLAYVTLYHKILIDFLNRWANACGLIGLLLIAGAISFFSKNLTFPGWWACIPVLGTTLLIIAGTKSWVGKKILSNKILVWFGLISFPLYLWHWPLLTFVKVVGGNSRWMTISAILLSIVLAWLSYRYVERSFRYGKALKEKSIFLAFGMLTVALLGWIVYSEGGFPFRIDDGHSGRLAAKYRLQLEWPENYNRSAECVAKYGADQYCLVENIAEPPTVALIGDSHANHFYPGLNEYYRNHGGNLILLGAGGCPPFFDISRVTKPPEPNLQCDRRTSHLHKFVLNDPHIKTVFIAFRHNLTFESNFIFDDKLHQLDSLDNYQATVLALTRTIKMLEAKGKQVVLLYDMPELNHDVRSCTFKRPHFSNGATCSLDQIGLIDDFANYNKLIETLLSNTQVKVFDTRPYIKGIFPIDGKDNLNYRDSTHLSYGGSMFFADKYDFKELKK